MFLERLWLEIGAEKQGWSEVAPAGTPWVVCRWGNTYSFVVSLSHT